MVYQSSIEKRLKKLEQVHTPEANRYICFVDVGQDVDEVVSKFRLDNNVQEGDILHVVRWKTA